MMRRGTTYSTSSVRRSSKSPLPPAVSSAAPSLKMFFAGVSASPFGAASVAVAMITVSKDEDEKDDRPSPSHP